MSNWNDFSIHQAWPQSSVHGPFVEAWNGYGTVGVYNAVGYDGNVQPTLLEVPASADGSAMVTTTSAYGDSTVDSWSNTYLPLRGLTANNWERAWVAWHGADVSYNGSVFHEFYYFIEKANGWELGKADPAYPGGQRFLATGGSPTWGLGQWSHISIASYRTGNSEVIEVYVHINGAPKLITSFNDTERPYFSGYVGLYDEGAVVLWGPMTVRSRP